MDAGALIEALPDAVVVLDADGRVLVTNAAVELLTGRRFAPGVDFTASIHRADAPAAVERFLQAFEGSAPTPSIDFRVQHADGSWRWCEARASNLADAPEIGGVLVSLRDVTMRREAEDALRSSEGRFRALAANSPVGIFDTGGAHDTVYFNPRLRQLFGFSPVDQPTVRDFAARIDPEDADGLIETIFAELGAGAVAAHTFRVKLAGSVLRWVSLRCVAVDDSVEGSDRMRVLGTVEDVTEHKLFETQLRYQATHDPLTGLPNRSLLVDRLRQALARMDRRESRLAVLFCDLDGFKEVNDAFGHETGDQILVAAALRLQEVVRAGDTVSRLGGDEFVVLCEDVPGTDEIVAIAERVVAALSTPFVLAMGEIRISASLGVALAMGPDDTADAVVRDADIALYQAKLRGKDCYEIFDEAMRRRASFGVVGEDDLVRAVDAGRLSLRHEPIVALDSGTMVAVEAVSRWRGAGRDELPGEEALGAAPSSLLLSSFHAWVLRHATKITLDVPGVAILPSANDVTRLVHMKMGERVLGHPGLAGLLQWAFDQAGVPGAQIVFEVSERLLKEQGVRLAGALDDLAALGAGIVVDEYGTGYASLAYLRRFPIRGIKLARPLLHGLTHDRRQIATVSSLIETAHGMGLMVMVKGVETYEQAAALHALGADLAQGPYFTPSGGLASRPRLTVVRDSPTV
jgi:diguanylate cyclase (GGDEF)-like protein/PAS domain S-box-containing protein